MFTGFPTLERLAQPGFRKHARPVAACRRLVLLGDCRLVGIGGESAVVDGGGHDVTRAEIPGLDALLVGNPFWGFQGGATRNEGKFGNGDPVGATGAGENNIPFPPGIAGHVGGKPVGGGGGFDVGYAEMTAGSAVV